MNRRRQYAARPLVARLPWAIRSILVQSGVTGLRPFGI